MTSEEAEALTRQLAELNAHLRNYLSWKYIPGDCYERNVASGMHPPWPHIIASVYTSTPES